MTATATIDSPEALESAAQVFTNCGLYRSATLIFCKLLADNPAHGMAWTGLAEALLRLSAAETDVSLLELSLSCVRRCLEVDAENFWAKRLEGTIQACTSLPDGRFEACPPLEAADPTELMIGALSLSPTRLAPDFDRVSWEERMLIVEWLGAQPDPDFVGLLIHAARDENNLVKRAALRPLSRWVSQPEVRGCFEALVSSPLTTPAVAADLRQALDEVGARSPEHRDWAGSLTKQIVG